MVEIKDKTVGTATRWAYCFCTGCAKQVGDSGGRNPQVLSARDPSSSLAAPLGDPLPILMLKCTALTVAPLTAIHFTTLLTTCEG